MTSKCYYTPPLEDSYGMKRCIEFPPPMMALLCFANSAGSGKGLMDMSATIRYVG
jgi:hypothetical protein